MLGCSAAVTETLSPSQLRPAVIHTMWTSDTAGFFCVDLPYGTVSGMAILLSDPRLEGGVDRRLSGKSGMLLALRSYQKSLNG
jgi:hypothetical protein